MTESYFDVRWKSMKAQWVATPLLFYRNIRTTYTTVYSLNHELDKYFEHKKLKIQIGIWIALEFWLRRIILRRFWTYSLMKCFFRNISSICSISNLMKTYFSYLLMIIMSSTYFTLVRNEQTATSAIINRSPTRHLHDTD